MAEILEAEAGKTSSAKVVTPTVRGSRVQAKRSLKKRWSIAQSRYLPRLHLTCSHYAEIF
jgi:hypothetical protein